MTASTRSSHRQTTPKPSEKVKNGESHDQEKQVSPASTASSPDDGDNNRERPVRRKLKKASIAGIGAQAHSKTASRSGSEGAEDSKTESGMKSQTSNTNNGEKEPRGRVPRRKRSFDDTEEGDSQEASKRNASKHIRKGSRETSESRAASEEPLTQGPASQEIIEDTKEDLESEVTKPNTDADSVTETAINSNSEVAATDDTPNSATSTVPRPSTPQLPPPTTEPESSKPPTSPGVKRSLDDFTETENDDTTDGKEKLDDVSSDKPKAVSSEATDEPKNKRHQDSLPSEKDEAPETAAIKVPATSGFANTSTLSPFASLAGIKSPSSFSNTSATSPFASLSKNKSDADLPQTSASAFAASGFASLAGSAQSPFATFGSAAKTNGDASKTAATSSGFGSLANSSASPFATAGATGSSAKNGFGGFASGFGGGSSSFGGGGFGGAPGTPLKSFASSTGTFGAAAKSAKPAETTAAAADEDEEDGEVADEEDPEKALVAEDESAKDARFYEQDVETGEEHENTVFQSRAKLYVTAEKQWKERGVGNFKINVTKESKKHTARFLMRADGVHRIVLNSPITKDLEIKDPVGGAPKGKTALFIGFIDQKPVTCQLKFRSNVQALELYQAVRDVQAKM